MFKGLFIKCYNFFTFVLANREAILEEAQDVVDTAEELDELADDVEDIF